MNRSDKNWFADMDANGWRMPAAPTWKKLPGIRHIRAMYHGIQVGRHQAFWSALGALNSGYDEWVLYGIWRGWERSE